MLDDQLIHPGAEVKALGNGRVGGYLVSFTDEANLDADGEFFDALTDLDIETGAIKSVYYNHGLDRKVGKRKIARGTLTLKADGAWIATQLDLADPLCKSLYQKVEAGHLGWSSGAVSHLVEKEKLGTAVRIKSWPVGEASLTPKPAAAQNRAYTLKTYQQILDLDEITIEDAVARLSLYLAEVKSGARNAKGDQEMVNSIHQLAVDLGCANCAGVKSTEQATKDEIARALVQHFHTQNRFLAAHYS